MSEWIDEFQLISLIPVLTPKLPKTLKQAPTQSGLVPFKLVLRYFFGMIKHCDGNQRTEKGEICSLIRQTSLWKRLFLVSDLK